MWLTICTLGKQRELYTNVERLKLNTFVKVVFAHFEKILWILYTDSFNHKTFIRDTPPSPDGSM